MTTTTTQIAVGQMIIIDGDVRTIIAIQGRWVKLDNGSNISRAAAADGRQEYIEDEELLGDEFDNEEDERMEPDSTDIQIMQLEDEEEEEDNGRSIVKKEYRVTYNKFQISKGHASLDNGDDIAQALRGRDVATLVAVAIQINPAIDGRWNHLNVGQRSMNARNVIRNAIKKGTTTLDIVLAHLES